MNKKMFLHNLALTIIILLVLAFSTAQVETNFPADFAGTWKRDKYNNTLTFTSNTINDRFSST
jgi:hypothetical protein